VTRRRFLAFLDPDRDRRRALAARATSAGLTTRRDDAAMTVMTEHEAPVLDLGDAGLILGELRAPGLAGPVHALTADDIDAIRRSGGAALIEGYWGDYLAFPADEAPAGVSIVRAPFGGPPCLHVTVGTMTVVGSDVALIAEAARWTPRPDWDGVARHLAASELRRRDTCLSGLGEVRGGDRLRVGAGRTRAETLWSPWRFTALDQRIGDPDEAAVRVRDAARACVAARVPPDRSALLLLSGGLDSSIVAACLAHAGRTFECLTVTTDDPTGDERAHARLVAERLGAPLLEAGRRLEHVDLERSSAAGAPRPTARSFEQDSDMLVAAAARASGALVVSGGGGDNVFSSLQSAAPAADCLLARDGTAAFWRTAREVSAMTGASFLTVARRAWARARRPDRGYRWPADRRFLTPAAAERAHGFDDHPWIRAPADTLPGRAAHAALLAPAQSLAEDAPSGASSAMPVLLSQPLVETCLRVPSRLWVERGCNRAAARRAFAPDLPPVIAWRRDKGTPDSFLVQLLERNRPTVRRLLLDGLLAERGIVDRGALARTLDDPRPTVGHDYVRVMQLVDVEVWARGW
jgi:asparagine synthase (glutamine-hydrolysing)